MRCSGTQHPRGLEMVVLTQFFPPETSAGANRVSVLVDSLAKACVVTVSTPMPSYPTANLYAGVDVARLDAGQPYCIRRVLQFDPHKGSLFVRAIREVIMSTLVACKAWTTKPSAVISSSPSMFLGPAGFVLAKMKSARFVWDIRDLTWRYAMESGRLTRFSRLLSLTLNSMMEFVLRRADLIVVTNDGARTDFISRGVRHRNVVVIPNGVSRQFVDDCNRRLAVKTELARSRPVVSYAGLIGLNQGLSIILDVAERLPGIDFIIAGDGPERRPLEALARQRHLANLAFLGYLNRAALLEVYGMSDVLFCQLRHSASLSGTAIPSKLFEYMAVGKPVVYSGDGIAAELVRCSGCGVTVWPGSPDAVASAIVGLIDSPAVRCEMGAKGREYVDTHCIRETVVNGLVSEIIARIAT